MRLPPQAAISTGSISFMFKFNRTKPALSAAIISGLLLMAAPATAQDAGKAAEAKPAAAAGSVLSRADVENIVRDFITENPQLILSSVDAYQQRSMQEQQTAAVKMNQDRLFRNERSPFIGNEKGDVIMVEFFDYNCGYCKKVFPELQELVKQDSNIKIVFKDLPILGPSSEQASKWALAAQRQNKYFEYHAAVMKHQGQLNTDVLTKIATDIGLDIDRAKQDAEGTDVMIQLEQNRSLAGQMNISGTPAFILGEEIIPGALPVAEMKVKIQQVRDAKKAQGGEKK